MIKVAPSILSANFALMGDAVKMLNDKDEFVTWWIYDRECGEKDSTVKYVNVLFYM